MDKLMLTKKEFKDELFSYLVDRYFWIVEGLNCLSDLTEENEMEVFNCVCFSKLIKFVDINSFNYR